LLTHRLTCLTHRPTRVLPLLPATTAAPPAAAKKDRRLALKEYPH